MVLWCVCVCFFLFKTFTKQTGSLIPFLSLGWSSRASMIWTYSFSNFSVNLLDLRELDIPLLQVLGYFPDLPFFWFLIFKVQMNSVQELSSDLRSKVLRKKKCQNFFFASENFRWKFQFTIYKCRTLNTSSCPFLLLTWVLSWIRRFWKWLEIPFIIIQGIFGSNSAL